jgi:sugar phosphate isomerase/epimerase
LPLGAGNLQLSRHIRSLQSIGYDGTITLEVFTADRHYLAYSREVLRRLWEECAAESRTSPASVLRPVS